MKKLKKSMGKWVQDRGASLFLKSFVIKSPFRSGFEIFFEISSF
jgi:hypothetical protein